MGKTNKSKVKRGISLIALVIIIIVVIILAGAVILSLSRNNPISSANEATFKSDIANIKDQLSLYISDKYGKNLGQYDVSEVTGKVSDFVPSITKYDSELTVIAGELSYIGTDITRKAQAKEMGLIVDLAEVGGLKYNKPEIDNLPESTTTAIKWDDSNNESSITLSQAKSDTSWYDYNNKKWANIKTANNGNEAYWVWIPRYAYKIENPHTTEAEEIKIKFLAGTSNVAADGSSLNGYTVHPAFTFGNKQLSGIWVAKYEASSIQQASMTEGGYTGYLGGGNDTNLQVRILPDVYSWRSITTGNAQIVSMKMTDAEGSVGTNVNIDTHQMKNVEWGVVAYLSQSQYGQDPWVNPYGDLTSGSYKLKTGYAGVSKDSGPLAEGNGSLAKYNTANGVKASTTGNIYGIYDMSGGSWEKVAAVLNNGNSNINTYGKAEHVENKKIKQEYTKYYDIYELGNEEKEGATFYGVGGENLWNSVAPYNVNQADNNVIRKRLTDATYANFVNKKGDGMWETSNGSSYYGKYTSGTGAYDWLIDTTRASSSGTQYTTGWNGDFMLIGNTYNCWFLRGGKFNDGSRSGLFAVGAIWGDPSPNHSFRPVLAVGSGL